MCLRLDNAEKTPDRFLGLAKRYIEQARQISSNSCAMRSGAKFNHHQCEYLTEKLRLAVESALLLRINRGYFFLEPENIENRLEMFKLLLVLSQEVENFIQDCCKDDWIQAVVLSSNVSGHISSLGFHLELCTILFQFWRRSAGLRNSLTLTEVDDIFKLEGFQVLGVLGTQELERRSLTFHLDLCIVPFYERRKRSARRSFTLTEVDGIFNTEAQTVKEQASLDMDMLLTDLGAVRETRKESGIEFQMAALMLERLERSGLMAAGDLSKSCSSRLIAAGDLPDQSNSTSLSERVFSSVERGVSLGKGTAATVYKATWHGAGVAMKVFEGPDNSDFQKEVSVLVGLSHPNIISVYCSTAGKRFCSIVMELMDKDLHTLMQDRLTEYDHQSPFDIVEAVDIMLQIGGGMSYLHEMRIVHRDLKSMNILVRSVRTSELEYIVAKVADFGLSKVKEKTTTFTMQTLNMGTTRWMAPEMLKSQEESQNVESQKERADGVEMMIRYPFKCDIYSFGMVCYEVLTGHQPFYETSSLAEIKKMVLKGMRPKLPNQCPGQLKRLIEKCWNSFAGERPSFGDICAELRHLKCALLIKCKSLCKYIGHGYTRYLVDFHGRLCLNQSSDP